MHRDVKIGMIAGLALAGGLMIYICTRPSLSPRARILKTEQPDAPAQTEPDLYKPTSVEVSPPQTQGHLQRPVAPTDYQQEDRIKTRRFYIVRKGDTLSAISLKYYGSANKWHKIYEANQDVLDNPDILKPGIKLIIPD